MFCQVVEQPIQRPVGISPSIATDVLQAILTVGELDGCGLAAVAYKIKIY